MVRLLPETPREADKTADATRDLMASEDAGGGDALGEACGLLQTPCAQSVAARPHPVIVSARPGARAQRGCPRHRSARQRAGPHASGERPFHCGCCAGTCEICRPELCPPVEPVIFPAGHAAVTREMMAEPVETVEPVGTPVGPPVEPVGTPVDGTPPPRALATVDSTCPRDGG